MGYSRQQFYEIRRDYQDYGAEGLLERLPSSLRYGVGTDAHAEEAHRAVRDYVSFARHSTERLPGSRAWPVYRPRHRSSVPETRRR